MGTPSGPNRQAGPTDGLEVITPPSGGNNNQEESSYSRLFAVKYLK